MKRFNFLVCYDIADAKRLQKIAKLLESFSIRIQFSLYYCMDVSADEMKELVKKLDDLMNQDEDDVCIYKVDKTKSLHLKSAVDLKQPNILGV